MDESTYNASNGPCAQGAHNQHGKPVADVPTACAEGAAIQGAAESSPKADGRRNNKGTPGNRGGQKGRSGPVGNRNAAKHFCRARVSLTALPATHHNITRTVGNHRATLEDACAEKYGEITLTHASTINVACWHESLARLWGRRLRDGYGTMDHATVALCTDRIARHVTARDAAIRSLDLDSNDGAAGFYGSSAALFNPPFPPERVKRSENTPAAAPCVVSDPADSEGTSAPSNAADERHGDGGRG